MCQGMTVSTLFNGTQHVEDCFLEFHYCEPYVEKNISTDWKKVFLGDCSNQVDGVKFCW